MTGGLRDTIAAIATATGTGGIGIVRVSGPAAIDIAARLTRVTSLPDRLMVHAHARAEGGELLDEVLVVAMRAPRSYTGEDVAELHGHGGSRNLARLLGAVLAAGARPAAPGEFTRRAFENGRLDLTQAEAVAQVIAAGSERALRAGQRQLAGETGRRVAALRAESVALLAELEAGIDFPEEGLEVAGTRELAARVEGLAAGCAALAATYAVGRALHAGLEVALVGAPNVGKSSLLNALVGDERALVAAEPGTTRDYVEARVVWDGIPVLLVDTAGSRDADSPVERRGVELGRARAARADVRLWVADATRPETGVGDEDALVVWNKSDVADAPPNARAVSAKTGAGLGELARAVLERALGPAGEGDEGVFVASARQHRLLLEAQAAAAAAGVALRERLPVELVAADVRIATSRLGEITGEQVGEDVLDELFASFCIGK